MLALRWSEVGPKTAGPLWYTVVLVAVAVLMVGELWVVARGTRSAVLTATSTVFVCAALAIVGVRLVALAS